MKVTELIEKLKQFDPNFEVMIENAIKDKLELGNSMVIVDNTWQGDKMENVIDFPKKIPKYCYGHMSKDDQEYLFSRYRENILAALGIEIKSSKKRYQKVMKFMSPLILRNLK